jgi:hypothetical protein
MLVVFVTTGNKVHSGVVSNATYLDTDSRNVSVS